MAVFAVTIAAASGRSVGAQETVGISVPLAVDFQVSDVSRSTNGAPSVTRVAFSNASLTPGKALRVSVQADTTAFTPPGGASIPASHVAWTNLGENGGLGTSGTLGASSYALVLQGNQMATSGFIDLGWTLAAPGSGIRAGTHQLTIRWKVESISP